MAIAVNILDLTTDGCDAFLIKGPSLRPPGPIIVFVSVLTFNWRNRNRETWTMMVTFYNLAMWKTGRVSSVGCVVFFVLLCF